MQWFIDDRHYLLQRVLVQRHSQHHPSLRNQEPNYPLSACLSSLDHGRLSSCRPRSTIYSNPLNAAKASSNSSNVKVSVPGDHTSYQHSSSCGLTTTSK